MQVADAKQPAWKSFPVAAKVRMHLLMGDILSAEQAAGDELIQPTSIPYARYTIFVCLANIELAIAKQEFDKALTLADELLDEVMPLTRVDCPAVLQCRGIALRGLGRMEEALQTFTEACLLARQTDSNLHLWVILSDLARAQADLGYEREARESLDEARGIVAGIADSLQEIGLRDSFLSRHPVRALMRE